MCDSSSWEGGARYASIKLYLGRGQFKGIKKADFQRQPPSDVVSALRRYGIDAHCLRSTSSWDGGRSVARILSAGSNVALSLDAARNVGTKVFLAATTGLACEHLIDQFKFQQKRKAS
jgi:hypothetical protein